MVTTRHARTRAGERMGLKPAAAERLAGKAFAEGLTHGEATGALARYLDRLYLSRGKADNLRVYGEFVWVFSGELLLTVFRVPRDYLAQALRAQRRKRESRGKDQAPGEPGAPAGEGLAARAGDDGRG